MKNKYLKILAVLIALLPLKSFSQKDSATQQNDQEANFQPCATVEYEAWAQKQHPGKYSVAQFEAWLAPKVQAVKSRRLMKSVFTNNYTVPVVVHIIHNGDPVGEAENITDEQVLSQITVLNQDFGRLEGTPGYNVNPVGADTGIQFCLAHQDPYGLPTSGIIRHHINMPSFEIPVIENMLKPQTQWDPSRYLNIWVVQDITMGGMPAVKGYASPPYDVFIEGIPYEDNTSETDGLVIAHYFFGSPALYPEGNYFDGCTGRTATHELGHYFGLRHIWGDGGCDVDDYCNDTPVAGTPTQQTCPAGKDSCPASPGFDMIQNYMDYSAESCMNIFTQDQRDRMIAVIENSALRNYLTNSAACSTAAATQNNGALQITNLGFMQCSNVLTSQLRLFNAGSASITAATIGYHLNNEAVQSYNWSGNLAPGASVLVNLPAVDVPAGNQVLYASLLSVNGTADENPFNDTVWKTLTAPLNVDTDEVVITITQDIFGSDITWALKDQAGTTIASGGPYEDLTGPGPLPVHEHHVAVTNGQCYNFTINDAFGDGLCCYSGPGGYTITTAEGDLIVRDAKYTTSVTTYFSVQQAMGTAGNAFQGLKLYPNPADDMLHIDMSEENILPHAYTVYNSLGQVLTTAEIKGPVEILTTEGYNAGIYFIKLERGEEQCTIRFVKR